MCNVINTTAVAISGSNLVLTIPAAVYYNDICYCINIAQAIPAAAASTNPVVIQIGTSTANNNIVRKSGHYLYANQIVSGKRYCLKVAADAGTFVLQRGYVAAANPGNVASITVVS